MKPEIRAQIAALGTAPTPQFFQQSMALMASFASPPDPAVGITRDVRYGPDPRNRLDIFRKGRSAKAPVLVYVHGGAFVMGDKTTPGSPFYDNFGQWAAQQGFIGVTITFRLAPAHRWPSGPEDLALAVSWLRMHIAASGGDPEAIFLVGQSSGAAHVAAYVSKPQFHPGGCAGIAGAVMISGIYDATTQPPNPMINAYYGEGMELRQQARCIDELVRSPLPLLFAITEFDLQDFHDQATQLTAAWHQHRGTYPPLEYLAGHNHNTPAQSLGSEVGDVGARIARFVTTVIAA